MTAAGVHVDREAIWDYCPEWCIEGSERYGDDLRVPDELHGEHHTGRWTGPGTTLEGDTVHVAIASHNRHGAVRNSELGRNRREWIQVGVGDEAPVLELTSPDARALARHLLHHADTLDGLR
jgi:hypothetical protein